MKTIFLSLFLVISLSYISESFAEYTILPTGIDVDPDTCAADLNADGIIGGADIALFALQFGRINCNSVIAPCLGDFYNDQDVDGWDAAFIADELGRPECPGTDDYLRPEVTVNVFPGMATAGDTVTISVHISDNVGVVSTTLQVNDTAVVLDDSGTATFSSITPGIFTAIATAVDTSGNEGVNSAEFRFIVPGDTTAPISLFESPEDDTVITEPTEIIGTVGDNHTMTRYLLEYSARNDSQFFIFAEGFLPVTSGVLGVLDPTKMRNGLYNIRLTVEDASGNRLSTSRTLQLDGETQTGNISVSFNDLTIPMPGIPITVTRRYDSRIHTRGDFGIGWNFDFNSIKIEENITPGHGWSIYCTQSIFGTCLAWGVRPSEQHFVLVSMEGEVQQVFDVQANTTYADQSGLAQGHLIFQAQPGAFVTLQSLDNVTYDFLLDGELFDFGFGEINPNRYRITKLDGTIYIYRQNTSSLEQMTDDIGNTITIVADGIIHSDGDSVSFTRDAQGRITTATDSMGNTIHYTYDFYGDLVNVTDQEGQTTWYIYNAFHKLLYIIDPSGTTLLVNSPVNDGGLTINFQRY